MPGSALRSPLHVAIVDVFAAPETAGLRVGVCTPPVPVDQCDEHWCQEIRQRLGVLVLLLRNCSSSTDMPDRREHKPIRAFDPGGELTTQTTSVIAGLVSASISEGRARRTEDVRRGDAGESLDEAGGQAWVGVNGIPTCRVRPALLASIGLAIGLRRTDLNRTLPSIVTSREPSTLVFPVHGRQNLELLSPDIVQFSKACTQAQLDGCFIYAATSSPIEFVARLFIPGIETSATIANPVVACALAKVLITNGHLDRGTPMTVEQLGPNGESSIIEIAPDTQPRSRMIRVGAQSRFTGWITLDIDTPVGHPHA